MTQENKSWIVRVFGVVPPHLIRNTWVRRTDKGVVSEKMPSPDFLLVECASGATMIYRYTKNEVFCGDTWHETLDHAREQIAAEYPEMTKEWIEAPIDTDEALTFGYSLVNQNP